MHPTDLGQAWHAATKDLSVWLIRALITTLVVSLLWWFWERVRRAAWRVLGRPGPRSDADGPGPEWRDAYLARLWPIPLLRRGLVVADGTRLVVFDHGVVQFELPSGRYSGREVTRRLARHAVGDAAVALQMADSGMAIDRVFGTSAAGDPGGRGTMSVGLTIDARALDRLKQSPLLRDGVLTKDKVFEMVDDVVTPWLAQAGAAHDPVASCMPDHVSGQVAARLHDQLGLVGSVHAVPPAAHGGYGAVGDVQTG